MSPATISRDVEEALDRQALRCRRLVLISAPNTRKHDRRVYRAELEDGRTIKARRLESESEARRLLTLRTGLEQAFAPVIGHHGPVLLEAWIEGTLLTELDPEAHAAEAGALLARLHATELEAAPPTVATRAWRERAAAELATLGEARALGPSVIARLAEELRRRDPGTARAALIHGDFCAENMLIDPAGRLRVIDNEWLSIGPCAFDLGRTFTRWPMSERAWRRFLRGYRSAARVDPGPLAFWEIVAALKSARIRSRQDSERLDVPLAFLRRFAERPEAVLDDPS